MKKTRIEKMHDEISLWLKERLQNQPDSRCASEEEVMIAWLLGENERLQAELREAEEKIEELEQNTCDVCDPENYGWQFNAVEGKAACVCMTEAEPYQILFKALEDIVNPARTRDSREIAYKALHEVEPLDY